MPDLGPAKVSAGFRKKNENLKNIRIQDFQKQKRLDHTQASCLCAMSIFFGTHSFHNPITGAFPFLAHLPKCKRANPSQHIRKLMPKQKRPKTNQGVCGKESLYLCHRVSNALLQSCLLSRIFQFASGLRPPNQRSRTHGSSQNHQD